MKPNSYVGIWLGITCGSLAIIHVIHPHTNLVVIGTICSILFFGSTLESPPKPKTIVKAAPKTKEEVAETRIVRRDLYDD